MHDYDKSKIDDNLKKDISSRLSHWRKNWLQKFLQPKKKKVYIQQN